MYLEVWNVFSLRWIERPHFAEGEHHPTHPPKRVDFEGSGHQTKASLLDHITPHNNNSNNNKKT